MGRDKSIAPREVVSPFSMGCSVLCLVFEGLHGWDIQTEINQTKAACASNRWISGLLFRHRDLHFNYHHQSMGIQMDVMHICNALTISLVQSSWGEFWGDLWQQMPGDSCRLGWWCWSTLDCWSSWVSQKDWCSCAHLTSTCSDLPSGKGSQNQIFRISYAFAYLYLEALILMILN